MDETTNLMQWAIQMYTQIAVYAVPIAFAFGMCNVIVNTFFSAAFGGRMRIGGEK